MRCFFRKSKRKFLGSLNETDLCDNKKFWGVDKPLLSNKNASNQKITFVEDDKIVENGKNTASVLNEVFSNIIIKLWIHQYNETKPMSHNISNPLMKAIIIYRFHPSITAIKKNCNSDFSFGLYQVESDEIMKEFDKLITNKALAYPQNLLWKNQIFWGMLFSEIIIIPFLILFFQTP